MGLPSEEFYGARIVEWGGACAGPDAEVELGIGGSCRFTPTGGSQIVTVHFEPRPALTITVSGHPDAVSSPNNYYRLTVTPEDQPDAPAPEVRWECAESPCTHMWNFDLGTEVRIEPTGADSLRRWGGACGGVQGADNAVLAEPCTVVLDADREVTMQRSPRAVPRHLQRAAGGERCLHLRSPVALYHCTNIGVSPWHARDRLPAQAGLLPQIEPVDSAPS